MLIFSTSFLRCVTLTDTELRVPRYHKTLVMPTVEMAGVGLLYHKEKYGRRAPSGWFVYAWRVDDSKEKLAPLFYNPGKLVEVGDETGRASRFVKKGSGDEIRSTNPALLASSRAGRVARQLYDGVLAIQGPLGNLSRLQMQRHPEVIASDAPETTAYWSPDGEMGRTASGT